MQPNLTSHILMSPDKHIVTILFCMVWYYGIVGKLDKAAVTKAICSGFKEATDPPVCLSEAVETNECLTNHGGCWAKGNVTACKDTFRGRVCECPLVEGVQFHGDGYSLCQGTAELFLIPLILPLVNFHKCIAFN
jgi:hypothetical protein